MPRWRIGAENGGGGFNIYCGDTLVGHTAEVSAANVPRYGGPVTAEQAKANAMLIVEAVNEKLARTDSSRPKEG
ncbi:MAG TPA: hypothetical protein VEA41_20760 [Salinarimonas sp.]|nr:hypothetical protein [Salinarimonas sp.]